MPKASLRDAEGEHPLAVCVHRVNHLLLIEACAQQPHFGWAGPRGIKHRSQPGERNIRPSTGRRDASRAGHRLRKPKNPWILHAMSADEHRMPALHDELSTAARLASLAESEQLSAVIYVGGHCSRLDREQGGRGDPTWPRRCARRQVASTS